MKPNQINQMVLELKNAARKLVEISDEWHQLEEKWNSTVADWVQRVIDIGQSLRESKAAHGSGWKHDYPTLGFDFSYNVACRYIACAKHPDARGEATTVEDWAKAAVNLERAQSNAKTTKETDRTKRSEARKFIDASSADDLVTHDEQALSETFSESAMVTAPIQSHLKLSVDSSIPDQLQESFDQLHHAIVSDPRLEQLRPLWQRCLRAWSKVGSLS